MFVGREQRLFPLVFQLIEAVIDALPLHQLGVGADLAHLAVLQVNIWDRAF